MHPSMPLEYRSNNRAPQLIHGYVSVRGSASIFVSGTKLTTSSAPFHATAATRTDVRRLLEQGGFRVIAESPLGLAVAGAPGAYEQLTGGKIVLVERLMRVGGDRVRYVTHVDIVSDNQPKALGVGYAATPSVNIDGILIQ